MTRAPVNYTGAEQGLREVGDEVTAVVDSIRTAIDRINAASGKMSALNQPAPTGYVDLMQYVETQAATYPDDEVWQGLKQRQDKMVGDFMTVSTYINNLIAAIGAVPV